MPTTTLMPVPKQRYYSNAGLPLIGGKVFTYGAGTNVLKQTFTDSAGTIPQANPIILNARGEPNSPIYWSGSYDIEVRDALNNLIYTVPNYNTDPAGIWNVFATLLLATGSSLIGFIQAGVGAILQTLQQKNRQTVHVMDFMTDAQRTDVIAGTLTLDVSAAIQAAIDAVSPTQGGATRAGTVLADPRHPMLVRTTINCTNSRSAGTKVRDGLRFLGFNLIGETGAGNCVIETTGSQWLELDGVITSGAATKSTVGVMQAISTVLQQTQNQNIKVRIFMHDDAAANGGVGTVGVWNFGAEENTYENAYVFANLPVFATSYKVSPNVVSVLPASFQAPLMAAHSTGVLTWKGETFLVALNARQPSLVTEDVNSFHMSNVYMANQGAGGANVAAWRAYGAFQGGSIEGTVEQYTGINIVGVAVGAKLRTTFGGLINAGDPRLVLSRGGQGQLVDCDIDFQDNVSSTRPLLSSPVVGTNEQTTCYIRNTTIRCNADKQYLTIPENLLWNPNTGNVTIEGFQNVNNPYRYTIEANRTHKIAIPTKTVWINAGITGAEVVRFVLPTIAGAANALGASVRITGIATVLGSTTGAMSVRYVDAVAAISLSQAGAITSAISNVFAGVQADTNAPGNSITAVTLTAVAAGTYVQLVISPTRTGVNNESVQFSGTAEMVWAGNESRAPNLQPAP